MPIETEMRFNPQQITRINKYLKSMPKKVNAELRKAMSVEANIVMKKSQENVPVITGLLKRSKYIRRAKSGQTVTSVVVGYEVKEARGNRKEVFDYAQVVEEGRKGYRPFDGRWYLRRAYNSAKRGRLQRVSKAVRKGLK